MESTKREDKSYTKVTRFYFRACSPLSIRVCKSATIEWALNFILTGHKSPLPWVENKEAEQ